MRELIEVTRHSPCPACGKQDWCCWGSGGVLICERCTDPPPGYTLIRERDGGAMFRPERKTPDAPRRPQRATGPKGTPAPTRDWAALLANLRPACDDGKTRALAAGLGLPIEAACAIEPGWADAEALRKLRAGGAGWRDDPPDGAWVFAECDGERGVIGLSLRVPDGRKGAPRGAKRGLVIPTHLDHADDPVLIVEGASDVAACYTLGIAAVGRPSNASGATHLAELLRGRRVIVVGENDQKPDGTWPGKSGAVSIAEELASAWGEPIVWSLPPDGAKDVRTWLSQRLGGDFTDFDAVLDAREGLLKALRSRGSAVEVQPRDGTPVLIRLEDVKPEPVSWLWPGRIPIGKLTLVAGDPGLGKSFLTLDIAARVSTGRSWPDHPGEANSPRGVVLLSAEDDPADTIRPRLDAVRADVSRIVALSAVHAVGPQRQAGTRGFDLSRDLPALESAIASVADCGLVVIDPVTAYLGDTDSHKNAEIRGLLAPLAELASRYRVAVVAVTHLNKGNGGPAVYRAMGSLAFAAAARGVWAVTKDVDDEGRRLLLPIKNNLASDTGGLAYRIEATGADGYPMVVWDPEPVGLSADDALGSDAGKVAGSALDEAKAWLADYLAGGPLPAGQVKDDAAEDGIASRTLDRAKRELGVEARREGFGAEGRWVWALPQSAPSKPLERQPSGRAHNGGAGALCEEEGDVRPGTGQLVPRREAPLEALEIGQPGSDAGTPELLPAVEPDADLRPNANTREVA